MFGIIGVYPFTATFTRPHHIAQHVFSKLSQVSPNRHHDLRPVMNAWSSSGLNRWILS